MKTNAILISFAAVILSWALIVLAKQKAKERDYPRVRRDMEKQMAIVSGHIHIFIVGQYFSHHAMPFGIKRGHGVKIDGKSVMREILALDPSLERHSAREQIGCHRDNWDKSARFWLSCRQFTKPNQIRGLRGCDDNQPRQGERQLQGLFYDKDRCAAMPL